MEPSTSLPALTKVRGIKMLTVGIIFTMLEMLTFIVYHGFMYILLFVGAVICIVAIFRFRAKNRLENVERRFTLYGMVTIFICIILVIVAWMTFFYAMSSLEDARLILGKTSHILTDSDTSKVQMDLTSAMTCLASFIILGLAAFLLFILGILLVVYKIDSKFKIFLLITMILMIVGMCIGSVLTINPSVGYIDLVNNITKVTTYDEIISLYNNLEKFEREFFWGSIVGAAFAIISSCVLLVGVWRVKFILKSRIGFAPPLYTPTSYQPFETTLQQHPVQYSCPYCRQPLRFVQEYQRWYCDNCKRYV